MTNLVDHRIGINLLTENLSSGVSILHEAGTPGGDSSHEDNGGLGSFFMQTNPDTDSLQLWSKTGTGANSVADWDQLTTKSYVDNLIINGISWREPVLAHDDTAYASLVAAQAAANVGNTVDGVTIASGDRILLSELLAGDQNVYIVGGVPGNWIFTVDTNTESDGDSLYVQEGVTFADQQWVYNGTAWVVAGAGGNAVELQAIRDFIGKSAAGAILPNYTSNNFVVDGNTLEASIGVLDAAIVSQVGNAMFTEQNEVVNGANITLNLDALDIQLGTGNPLSTNILLAANDITENLSSLDVAIGTRAYTNNTYLTDGEPITASLDALADELGNETTGTNIVLAANTVNANLDLIDGVIDNRIYTEQNVVTSGETISDSLEAIDIAIGALQSDHITTKTANVIALAVVAMTPTATTDVAVYHVTVQEVASPANRISGYVSVMHNGVITDDTFSNVLRIPNGLQIPGLTLSSDVSGGQMRLLMSSTNGINVSAKLHVTDTIV